MNIFKRSLIGVVVILSVLMTTGISYPFAPTISSVTVDKKTNVVTIKGGNFEKGARVSLRDSGPFLLGSYDARGDADGMYISGNYAYLTVDKYDKPFSELLIIDITNPSSPELTGSYRIEKTQGTITGVQVSGRYAYIAVSNIGMQVIDISIPAEPKLIGFYKKADEKSEGMSPDEYLSGLYLSGNYIYITSSRGLRIIDISNPSAPKLTGYYKIKDVKDIYGVYVSGRYLYIALGELGFQIVDIKTPSSPKLVGSYKTKGEIRRIYVSGDYAYVVGGLQIINIKNPSKPKHISSYNVRGSTYSKIYVSGNYAYLSFHEYLKIIDITNPYSPKLADSYDAPSDIGNIYVSGNYAYILVQRHDFPPFGGCVIMQIFAW